LCEVFKVWLKPWIILCRFLSWDWFFIAMNEYKEVEYQWKFRKSCAAKWKNFEEFFVTWISKRFQEKWENFFLLSLKKEWIMRSVVEEQRFFILNEILKSKNR
jgi:hypothetical protein